MLRFWASKRTKITSRRLPGVHVCLRPAARVTGS